MEEQLEQQQQVINETNVTDLQEEDQETAVELQLLTQKSGKIPAVFYD